ncbi:unnamed protein product [Chilo suppressalis]|uniref:EF-hand domain-containing protein n=1 Tax=Chilo suppressalis TaxID=168631 RepID=A0ABN8AQ15_CHISP|nr:unnamed protein product [Chilo suppressalis]
MDEDTVEVVGITENQADIGGGEIIESNEINVTDGTEGNKATEKAATEHIEGEQLQEEQTEGEHVEGEHVEGEYVKDEQSDAEGREGEHSEGDEKEKNMSEGEELMGEEQQGEHVEVEEVKVEEKEEEVPVVAEEVEEEEAYAEEPPPDPSAPYDFTDSKEALREPFELRPDQLAEVEQLWELYQNYTPVYTDIDGYITEKELVYMLKALLLMTYTPEQLQELIAFCVRPPHPEGHITYEQFLKMVIVRQREFPIEDELRSALQVLDPERTGSMDREQLKDLLATKGHKLTDKQLNNLMKEVDISNDGTIGVEDVVGTMCIDLNKEDIQMLLASLNPNPPEEPPDDQF